MLEGVHLATSAQNANWAAVSASAATLNAQLVDVLARLDLRASQQIVASAGALKARVEAILARGEFHELSRAELRVATGLLLSTPIERVEGLLRARPDGLSSFVDAFFANWTQLREVPSRPRLVRLAASASIGARVLHRGLNNQTLLGSGAPAYVAGKEAVLADLARVLFTDLRCGWGWQFTHEVVAHWVAEAFSRRSLAEVEEEIASQARAVSSVFPAVSGRTWFRGWPTTGGGTAPVTCQAAVVVAMLRRCLDSRTERAAQLIQVLLGSSFGDPRIPPVPHAWTLVRAGSPQLFDEFIASLVKEDLSLFFRYAMREDDRERFWLDYLPIIRGTQCILAPSDHAALSRQLVATEAGRAALGRATRGHGSGASAFCLFFDRIVVVEFSDAGNAAYVYNRASFEQHVLPSLKSSKLNAQTDLKRRDIAAERIVHGWDWTTRARDVLATLGVVNTSPSRRR